MRTAHRSWLVSILPLLAIGASLSTGCDGGGGDDGGSTETDAGVVVITFDAGPLPAPSDGGTPDAGPANTVVFVTGVTPPNGPLGGGNRVVFEGESFDPTCVVRIGGVEATRCLFLTTRSMSCEILRC